MGRRQKPKPCKTRPGMCSRRALRGRPRKLKGLITTPRELLPLPKSELLCLRLDLRSRERRDLLEPESCLQGRPKRRRGVRLLLCRLGLCGFREYSRAALFCPYAHK